MEIAPLFTETGIMPFRVRRFIPLSVYLQYLLLKLFLCLLFCWEICIFEVVFVLLAYMCAILWECMNVIP